MNPSKLLLSGCLLLAAAIPVSAADAFRVRQPADDQIVHALNRLTWGPRPGDVERVRRQGLKKWLEAQLNPQRVAENPNLAGRLRRLETLWMEPGELAAKYPPPAYIVSVAQGKLPLPEDPEVRAIVESLADRYRRRTAAGTPEEEPAGTGKAQLKNVLMPQQLRTMRVGTPEERVDLLLGLPPEELLQVLEAMPKRLRQATVVAAPPELRRKLLWVGRPHEVVAADLMEAKLLRAVYSERQLEDVLTDFWFNHFNVFLDKGADRYLTTSYERDAIRPYVLGKFRDLLRATAQHPAMLFYLDNWQSTVEGSGKRERGLNENYARELMELHTLGVGGGYRQKDVREVARCFTGWTVLQPFRAPRFQFDPRRHDDGDKTVLGHRIAAGGGQQDGWRVLDLLARHPSTARFLSQKLAERFVADDPPESLVERMAATFRHTDGDLRKVMQTMVRSPEFWSQGAWHAKVKTPLEMVVSSLRASGATVDSAFALSVKIGELGQPLYRKLEPTGYSSKAAEWVNSAALLGRMNLAMALAGNQIPGVKVTSTEDPDSGQMARRLLQGEPSESVKQALLSSNQHPSVSEAQRLAGVVLGSPDFQRR